MVQAEAPGSAGIISYRYFLLYCGTLVLKKDHLNTAAYLDFMSTVNPHCGDHFQQDNAPCHKSQIVEYMFMENSNVFSVLKWSPQSIDLSPIEHHSDMGGKEIRILDVQPI